MNHKASGRSLPGLIGTYGSSHTILVSDLVAEHEANSLFIPEGYLVSILDALKPFAYPAHTGSNLPVGTENIKFVNTSMHGVSDPFVRRAFDTFGVPQYIPVEAQQRPDPEFPTVRFPNPEEKGALVSSLTSL